MTSVNSSTSVMPVLPPLADRRVTDLLARRAAGQADETFIVLPHERETWTFGSLWESATRLATGLRSLGLGPGDKCAIILPNSSEYLLTWFASMIVGSVDAAVSGGLHGALLAHQLRIASVKIAICDEVTRESVREIAHELPDLEVVVVVGQALARQTRPREVPFLTLFKEPPLDPYASDPAQPVSIRYTSGTTGPAKAVAMTHSRVTTAAVQYAWITEYVPTDRLYTCFPLQHGLASFYGVVATLVAGGSIVIDRRFSAREFWTRIRQYDATMAHIVNPLVAILLRQEHKLDDRTHRCSRLWTAVPNPAFEERFGARLINFYGQSEGNVIAYMPPGEQAPNGSAGRPSPLFDIQVCDEHDYSVPPGERGQILWRPREPHLVTPGYAGDPVATVNAWQNLWFHTGDEGYFDEAGFLYLVGRMGDQIRRRGVNIAAADIEAVALRFGGIQEAAAFAVPSDLGESEAVLAVVPTDAVGFTVEGLARYLREQLPREMVPRYLEVRSSFPVTSTYKVPKAELRSRWLGGLVPSGAIDIAIEGPGR